MLSRPYVSLTTDFASSSGISSTSATAWTISLTVRPSTQFPHQRRDRVEVMGNLAGAVVQHNTVGEIVALHRLRALRSHTFE